MWLAKKNISLDFSLVSGRWLTTNLDDDILHRLVAVNTKIFSSSSRNSEEFLD